KCVRCRRTRFWLSALVSPAPPVWTTACSGFASSSHPPLVPLRSGVLRLPTKISNFPSNPSPVAASSEGVCITLTD
ncbi:RING/FYVE/PHD-type zinc finger family protein, partial [Zea mays]